MLKLPSLKMNNQRHLNRLLIYLAIIPVLLIVTLTLMKPDVILANGTKNTQDQWALQDYQIGHQNIQSLTGFKGPYGITYHNGKFYIPDLRDARVIEFSKTLTPLRWLGFRVGKGQWHSDFNQRSDPDQQNGFKGAHAITFIKDGRFLVTDYFANRIALFSARGHFIEFLDFGGVLPKTYGVASAIKDKDEYIWIADFDGHKMIKLDPELNFVGCLGYDGTKANIGFQRDCDMKKSDYLGGFHKPHMVAFLENGHFLVVETGNHRVQIFSEEGISLGQTGDDGSGVIGFRKNGRTVPSSSEYGLRDPVSIAKTQSGDFIIADNGNHRIVKMNAEGQFLGWFNGSYDGVTLPWSPSASRPEKGNKIGYFAHPFHAIEVGNKIYVADGHNNRIVVYPTPQ